MKIKALFQKITCNGSREMTEERFIQAMEEHTAPLTCYSKDIQKELPVLLNDFANEIIENPNGSIRRFQNAIIELFKSPQSITEEENKGWQMDSDYIEKLAEEHYFETEGSYTPEQSFIAGFKKALSLTSEKELFINGIPACSTCAHCICICDVKEF